jgi:DNA polymerase III sliding clamp (beta) subunit (PCNA family)
MKIKRTELVQVLETIKPAVASGGAIPELRHVWFDGNFAYAYDGGLGIRVPYESEITGGMVAASLLGLLNSTKAEEVSLDLSKSADAVLTMGRAKATVPVLDGERNPWPFPTELKKKKNETALSIELSEELIKGLQRAETVKASRPVRVEHYGVVLFPSGNSVTLYTTDSRALAQITVPAQLDEDLSRVVLPHGFVSQLIKLGKGGGSVTFLEDAIIAQLTSAYVCSNLLDSADVQDLPAVVEEKANGSAKRLTLPEGFLEALTRAGVLVGADPAYIDLAVGKKELALSAKLPLGELQEKLPLSGPVTTGEICVALDCLTDLSKDAQEFAIAESALVLYGQEGALYLVAAHTG